MSDDLIGKADALMRRHRVFVAGGSRPAADEDVPILTEVVDDGSTPTAPGPSADALEHQVRERLEALRQAQQADVGRIVEAWAAEQLPALVTEALAGLADRVSARLAADARQELSLRLRAVLEREPPAVD